MTWTDFRPSIQYLSEADQKRIHHAYEFGMEAHAGQLRKSGEPFFTHPITVAKMLTAMGADRDTVIAALLHDTVEDTFVTLEALEEKFGSSVASLINGLTKLAVDTVSENPNINQQIESLRKMFTLMQEDIRIMVIKLVDRLHNVQTAQFLPDEKKKFLARETEDIYIKIADRLSMEAVRDELEGLVINMNDPSLFEHLSELRVKNKTESKTIIKFMKQAMDSVSSPSSIDIEWEQKPWNTLKKQLDVDGPLATGETALHLAFICDDIDTCYHVLGTLHQLWKREVLSFEDYINAPRINGYRGLHTTIIMEDGTRIRCKIRTPEMHKYAQKGISALCFDKKAIGILDYLPWTKQISPLSQGTLNRSQEFWESLRSDILGESIVIHGPADQTVLLPKGGTALDGVFYLYGEKGLYTSDIYVNGRPAALHEELHNACTLSANFTSEMQMTLTWLQYARTGLSSAIIRQGLVSQNREEKMLIGKNVLQKYFTDKRRGFIGEFDLPSLEQKLRFRGYGTLEEIYLQIAEGRLFSQEIERALFEQPKDIPLSELDRDYILTCRIPSANHRLLPEILQSFRVHSVDLQDKGTHMSYHIRLALSDIEKHMLERILQSAVDFPTWHLQTARSHITLRILMGVLILLWGLDPVFARVMLQEEISAATLTFMRFAMFFVVSATTYGLQTYLFSNQKLKTLPPFQPPLIFSGVALFVTGLFTYLALQELYATQYILFIVTGVLVTNIRKAIIEKRSWEYPLLSITLLLVGLVALGKIHETSFLGSIYGLLGAAGFAFYSEITRRYQQKEETIIHARYPAFLFWISGTTAFLSIFIPLFYNIEIPSPEILFKGLGFVLIFSILPYIIYFELMRRTDTHFLDYSLPFVCVSTILGELFLTGSTSLFIATPILLLFLAQYFYQRRLTA